MEMTTFSMESQLVSMPDSYLPINQINVLINAPPSSPNISYGFAITYPLFHIGKVLVMLFGEILFILFKRCRALKIQV